MEEILARYLDGELSDREAERLLRGAEDDPRMGLALREYEALLESATRLPSLSPPSEFGDGVMAEIEAQEREAVRPHASIFRRSWLAAAAVLVLGIAIGYWGSLWNRAPGARSEGPPFAGAVVVPETLTKGEPGVEYLRTVRLVYAGSHPDVRSVAVAGSFNGWNPRTAPLRREGDVWTTLLVLPPGSHEYMFIEDGRRWVTDPAASRTRKDGFGGSNGLLDVTL